MTHQTIAHYKIIASIGAGGMGEVFRARDTRLNRDVAIKVLPKDFATDADRLRRFEQESKTLAALNHPNILTLHDAGVHQGAPYLVSELLEGTTLREELKPDRPGLPVRKTVEYALQIAQGLAAAHSKGIVHRDLKPENIFITKEARVKILDFGLAKLQSDLKGGALTSESRADPDAPTLAASTQAGMVLGTPDYMSPEQVRGEPVDHRSDIFAFGCVLYEMLSGARVFRRDTPIASMHAVLTEEPQELRNNRQNIPPLLESIIHRCLEKQAPDRFQSAKDLAFSIEAAAAGSKEMPSGGARSHSPPGWQKVALFSLAAAAFAIVGGLVTVTMRSPSRPATIPSIRYVTYSGRDFSPSVSPNGKLICFSSDRTGTRRIWVKDMISGSEKALTEGPDDSPRFSPDGSAILFTRAAGEKRALFRVPALTGSEPFKVAEDAVSGDWSPDGRVIAFVRWNEASSWVFVVGVDGSGETLLHRFTDERCSSVRWSPDGKTIATAINDTSRPQSLQLIDVRTGRVRSIKAPDPYNELSSVVWDKTSRHLFFMQAESSAANSSGSTAFLFRYAVASGRLQELLWSPTHARILDLLPSGNLVLDSRSSRENLKVTSIGDGGATPLSLTLGNATDRQPAYAPDGQTIVFSSNRGGNLDLWSISTNGGAAHRLTDDAADDWDPGFSPDGRHLLWSSKRSGNFEIWLANADGTAPTQVTHDGFAAENPTMTPDSRWIVYGSTHPGTAGIWKIHPDGTGAAQLYPGAACGNSEVSPDGKYAAFRDSSAPSYTMIRVVEVESGTVVPFKIRVPIVKETSAVIGRVRWMPSGKALVFLGQNESGVNGLFVQDFIPGRDTGSSRRPVGPFDHENSAESFGISPDGRFITIAAWEQFFSIMRTEDLSL